MKHVLCYMLLAILDIPCPVSGHTLSQTNELIRSMLRPAAVRPSFDVQTQSFMAWPRGVASQDAFFAGDEDWPESDRRGAFMWYLHNLRQTSRVAGVVPDRGAVVENPQACVAIAQCSVMNYTNALEALIAHVRGPSDPSRGDALTLVLQWCALGTATTLVEDIVTNETGYTALERNVAYRDLVGRLAHNAASGQNGDLSWSDALNFLYSRRSDPIGAVTIDKFLSENHAGYETSSVRFGTALAILNDANSLRTCCAYFSSVTNHLQSAIRK